MNDHNNAYYAGNETTRVKLTRYASKPDQDERIKFTGARLLEPEEQESMDASEFVIDDEVDAHANASGGGRRLRALPRVCDGSSSKGIQNGCDWSSWLPDAIISQSPCDSCWAFGAALAITGNFHLNLARQPSQQANNFPLNWVKNRLVSAQQLMDCNAGYDGKTMCKGPESGGVVQHAFRWVGDRSGRGGNGVVRDADQTYLFKDGVCTNAGVKTRLSCRTATNGVARGCKNTNALPYSCISDKKMSNTDFNKQLMKMLEISPVPLVIQSCALRADHWDGVVLQSTNWGCRKNNLPPAARGLADHIVTLVGWGTDRKHGDYWKIRNTWGWEMNGGKSEAWGDEGYARIERTDRGTLFGRMRAKDPSEQNPCIPLGARYW